MPTGTLTGTLRAGVQYNDWTGTSAADDAGRIDLKDWLVGQKLMTDDESLLAFELLAGENHGTHKDPLQCRALVAASGGFDNVKAMIEGTKGPVPVRRINFDMNAVDFLALFKRFSVSMSIKGILDPDRDFVYASTP